MPDTTALAKHIRTVDSDDESVTVEIRHTETSRSEFRVPRAAFIKMCSIWGNCPAPDAR